MKGAGREVVLAAVERIGAKAAALDTIGRKHGFGSLMAMAKNIVADLDEISAALEAAATPTEKPQS